MKHFIFLFFLISAFNLSAQPTPDEGKALFKANCASCHNKTMKDDMTGPALGGVRERWEGDQERLYAWIRNSQAVIASGDSYAVALYNKWDKSVMTAFPNLTDDQIESILLYIDGMYDGTYGVPVGELAVAVDSGPQEEGNNTFLFATLFLILAILSVALARIIGNLNRMAQIRDGESPAPQRSIMEILTSRSVVSFVIFSLVVLGGFTTVNNAINLGRQQGYAPNQPIKFSHATHAGLQQIDCQYCHDGARRSKHSVIPATNTCMNCHRAIKKGSQYGTAELTKIYASIGYDPTTDKYVGPKSDEELMEIYTKWIEESYLKDNATNAKYEGKEKKLKEDAAIAAETQWADIVSSLTNGADDTEIQGAIEWVRLHNLPDHVYFNHAQHVAVGKVECQNCHGPVEKMEVVQQYAPLSMGWCINCHRETEVQFADNDYYQHYEVYHEELKSGKRDKVTVEDIGGLECQKCHY
ncbi:MAG: c-type cytochrome [Bacteroidota bacterium]